MCPSRRRRRPTPADRVAAVRDVGVPGWPDLMHHKYVIRDGTSVWTGSMNWTDDSWTRQENVIVTVESREPSRRFEQDFEQLWTTRDVERSGKVDSGPSRVDRMPVRAWFSPGHGERLAHEIASRIARANAASGSRRR